MAESRLSVSTKTPETAGDAAINASMTEVMETN